MKTIKLELSVKLLMGAIALGLFLNVFKDFPPKANADVAGMDYYDLKSDYDFKKAVKRVVSGYCRVYDGDENISC